LTGRNEASPSSLFTSAKSRPPWPAFRFRSGLLRAAAATSVRLRNRAYRRLHAQVLCLQIGVMGAPARSKEGRMKAVGKWQGLATLAVMGALAIAIAALTPGALAAAPVHSCGNKVVVLEQPGETGQPATKFKLLIKQITSQGVSCSDAFKVVNALYTGSATPEKYKCTAGHFKVPVGRVPEVCTKPGKRITFAGQGG
jgi:hypothetical protein